MIRVEQVIILEPGIDVVAGKNEHRRFGGGQETAMRQADQAAELRKPALYGLILNEERIERVGLGMRQISKDNDQSLSRGHIEGAYYPRVWRLQIVNFRRRKLGQGITSRCLARVQLEPQIEDLAKPCRFVFYAGRVGGSQFVVHCATRLREWALASRGDR